MLGRQYCNGALARPVRSLCSERVKANSAEAIGALLADASHIVWEGAQEFCSIGTSAFIRTPRGATYARKRRCTWPETMGCATTTSPRSLCCAVIWFATARDHCRRRMLRSARLLEPHNSDDGWQGKFRRGHLDFVLLRYALRACAGTVDALMLTPC